jgi:hypothetical protein
MGLTQCVDESAGPVQVNLLIMGASPAVVSDPEFRRHLGKSFEPAGIPSRSGPELAPGQRRTEVQRSDAPVRSPR